MARTPEGEGDWVWAEKQAVNHTILVPNKGRHYRLAYSLCHYLSQLRPFQPFPLPVRKVTDFLGASSLDTGAKAVRWLERDGRLRKCAEHSVTQNARDFEQGSHHTTLPCSGTLYGQRGPSPGTRRLPHAQGAPLPVLQHRARHSVRVRM
jgi:hypothetical protein